MCLKNNNPELSEKERNVYERDIIYFAFIHEISHIGCVIIGHTN